MKKCVLPDAELSLKSIVVQHLAVQFRCHQHFIKLSVLILGRKDVDLVGAVGKPDSGQHPVDLPPVPVRRLNLPVDGGDHIFPEGVVDQAVLVLKFLLIPWLIVPLQVFPQLIVHVVFVFHPGKSIGRIFPVKTVPGQYPLFRRLFLLPRKPLAQVILLSAVSGLCLDSQIFPNLRKQLLVCPEAFLQPGQPVLKISVFLLGCPEIPLPADPFLVDLLLDTGKLCDPLLQNFLLAF